MTYAAFRAAVKLAVWPEGEALELATQHNNLVVEALIDLQMKIPCLRTVHEDTHSASGTFFQCGSTTVPVPRGKIRRIWTETTDANCSKVYYEPTSIEDIECRVNQVSACEYDHPYGYYWTDDVYVAYGEGPQRGFEWMGGGADKTCRATAGVVALHRDYLHLFPHIQENEIVVVEWDGIKRTWADADSVSDDRDLAQAVEYYMIGMHSLTFDSDAKRGQAFFSDEIKKPGLYQNLVRKMIYRCREETTLRGPVEYCFDSTSACATCG